MLNYVISSGPLVNFDFAMYDVDRLLLLHDSERTRPKDSRRVEVFMRAAVILSVTAWETFIEDTIKSAAEKRVSEAATPDDISTTFNSVAHSWIETNPKLNPPLLKSWVGDGWKALIYERLETEMGALNTPNSENVRRLSKRYLAIDLTSKWLWRATSADAAQKRLDDFIRLRGGLVHRGQRVFEDAPVKRKHVVDGVSLLRKLVRCTERALGVGPRGSG